MEQVSINLDTQVEETTAEKCNFTPTTRGSAQKPVELPRSRENVKVVGLQVEVETTQASLVYVRLAHIFDTIGVLLQLSPPDTQSVCRALVLLSPTACEWLLHNGVVVEERRLGVSMLEICKHKSAFLEGLQSAPSSTFASDHSNNSPDGDSDKYAIIHVAAHSQSSPRDVEVIISIYDPQACIVLGALELGWFVFQFKDQRCLEQLLKIEYISAGKTFLHIELASSDVAGFIKRQRNLHKEPLMFTKTDSGSCCVLEYVSYGTSCQSAPIATETTPSSDHNINKTDLGAHLSPSHSNSWKPELRLNLECKPRYPYGYVLKARQRAKDAANLAMIPPFWTGSAIAGSGAVPRAIRDMLAQAEWVRPDENTGGDPAQHSDSEPPLSRFSEPFLDFSESSISPADGARLLAQPPLRQTRRAGALRVQLEQKVVTTVRLTDGSGVSYRQVLEEDNVWEFRL